MIFSARQGDTELSRRLNLAIREEIGERLAIGMKPKLTGMPPHLTMLVKQLRDEPPHLCQQDQESCSSDEASATVKTRRPKGSKLDADTGANLKAH
jgi:hypothetical protein